MRTLGGAVRRSPTQQQDRAPPRAVVAPIRWLATHEHAAAALLFAVFVLVYLWPVLIGGDVLSPRSNLFQFAPWSTAAPAGWEAATNFILGDVAMAHYPFHVIARDSIRDGVLPVWSQHAYAGVPFLANPQTLVLSAFALPIWILPLELGIGVSAALKLWMAGFGTYLLVRELRLSFWPAMLAGISFALCAFSVLWLTHETLLAVAAMLPWTIWLTERIARTGGPGPAIALALVTALAMTGGHPGTQVHVLLATGIYALVRLLNTPGLVRGQRAKRAALVGGGIVVGVLLTAVLLIPVLKAGSGTIGVEARNGVNETIPGSQLPFGAIRTALFPDWWGRPSDLSLEGPANYNERTFYAGGIATILALLALLSPGMWRRKAPFAGIAALGLAVPLHVPVVFWLATHLPLLRQVQFQRMMLLYAFAIAVLGAFGLQRLIDAPRERRRTLGVLTAAAGTGIVALLAANVGGRDLADAAGNIVHLRHAVGTLVSGLPSPSGELVGTSVLWWLVLVAAFAAALLALRRWPRRAAGIACALVLLAALDLQYFAHDYQPMAPASEITPAHTPAVSYLQRHADDGRFVGIAGTLLNDWSAALYGLRDVRGYDPPQPSLRWFHLWQTHLNPQQLDWAQAMLDMLPSPAGLNTLAVLGARYIAIPAGNKVEETLPQVRVGYEGPDAIVLVNPLAPPRALVARDVIVTGSEDETIEAIAHDEFDPRRQAIVERTEPGAAALGDLDGSGRVAVASETATSVTLRATLNSRSLVVLNDAIAPGWSVRVDGHDASALRVNDVMRGVVADAGEHEIVWRYRAPGLRLGTVVSALALTLLLAAGTLLLRTRRQQRPLKPAA